MKANILFFDIDNAQHAAIIENVAKAGFTPIMNATSVRASVTANGIRVRNWELIRHEAITHLCADVVGQISKQLVARFESPDLLDSVFASESGNFMHYTGVDFAERLMCCIADQIATIERLREHAKRGNLRLVVLGCDNTHLERSIVLTARDLGIPTLQLAHGISGTARRARSAGSMQSVFSDYVAVFGGREAACLQEMGVARDRIFVTGAPHLDKLYDQQDHLSKAAARDHLGLAADHPVILFSPSYVDGSSAFFPTCTQAMFEQLRQLWQAAHATNAQAQIILRPHPNELLRATNSETFQRETDELFAEWLDREGMSNIQILRENKMESILASDVVVTSGITTFILEAMILQRPVIARPWIKDQPLFPLDESSGIVISQDETMLADHLRALLTSDRSRQEAIARQNQALPSLNCRNDGRSTERVTDVILELAGKPRGHMTPSDAGRQVDLQGQSPESQRTEKLRIVQIVHDFPPRAFSGTELYTLHLSRELEKLGHDVSVVYPSHLSDHPPYSFVQDEYEGLTVFKFNVADGEPASRSDFLNASYDAPFRRFLQGRNFDIVHFQHIYGLSVNWISIAKELNLPVFLKVDDMFWYCRQIHLMQFGREHCSGPTSIDKCVDCLLRSEMSSEQSEPEQLKSYLTVREAALQNAFRQVDLVHSPSQFLKTTSLATGLIHDEFHVIPTGILPFEVQKRKKVRKQIRVGYFGEIDLRKGIQHFLEAIELAQPELVGATTALKFVIYGNHRGDALYESMLKAIDRLSNIEYRGGFTPDRRAEIFSEIDVLVMPSLGENYPFMLREALFAGLPVIATAIAGVPEIVEPGRNGWLFPQGDTRALADILLELAAKSAPFRHLKLDSTKIRLVADEALELQRLYAKFGQLPSSPKATQVAKLFEKGKDLIDTGNLKQGLEALSSVLNLDPKHPPSLRLLSDVYRRLGKDDEAQRLLALAES